MDSTLTLLPINMFTTADQIFNISGNRVFVPRVVLRPSTANPSGFAPLTQDGTMVLALRFDESQSTPVPFGSADGCANAIGVEFKKIIVRIVQSAQQNLPGAVFFIAVARDVTASFVNSTGVQPYISGCPTYARGHNT